MPSRTIRWCDDYATELSNWATPLIWSQRRQRPPERPGNPHFHISPQFFKEYRDGKVTGIVFIIPVLSGELPIRLPARVEQVKQKLYGKRAVYTPAMEEQARRTAWANIRDWLDAQMALIETGQVRLEEVLLPYLTDTSGKT